MANANITHTTYKYSMSKFICIGKYNSKFSFHNFNFLVFKNICSVKRFQSDDSAFRAAVFITIVHWAQVYMVGAESVGAPIIGCWSPIDKVFVHVSWRCVWAALGPWCVCPSRMPQCSTTLAPPTTTRVHFLQFIFPARIASWEIFIHRRSRKWLKPRPVALVRHRSKRRDSERKDV